MGRIKEKINRDWKFIRHDQPFPGYKGIDDSQWETITLPHDWSVTEDFDQKYSSGTGYLANGVGWYRKRFTLPEEYSHKRVYVTFEGVYNHSQVWCNSSYLNKRPSGYSSFTYDITDFVNFGSSDNVISVRVDHKDSADSRWFTGSGIYRNVYLTMTDQVHLKEYGVFVTTPDVSRHRAQVQVETDLINHMTKEKTLTLEAVLSDSDGLSCAQVESAPFTIGADDEISHSLSLSVENPQLWSPDHAALYTISVRLKESDRILDSYDGNMGFRFFHFDPEKGFFLNGDSLKMKGVCLHHDAGCLGAAVPKKVWAKRLADLKDAGCNAIRCSHNPPAPDFLDLCDEMGFLVQDEAFDEWEGVKNKWWQGHNVYPPRHFGYYEDFPEWHQRDLQDMVKRDRNHTSIIFWSIGNEIDYPNDPYCHPSFAQMTGNNDENKPEIERMYDPNKPNAEHLVRISKRLVKLVKECDSTRPVTAALAFPELSNITGLSESLDIVGYNYKEQCYSEAADKWPDRVVYGSENSKDLEAWQAVENNPRICAQFLWTGIDFLGEAQGWPVRISAAGILDCGGHKKASYYYRQSLWSPNPMVMLTTMKKVDRELYDGEVFHWNYSEGESVVIRGYSNCEQVELFINGKSEGIQNPRENKDRYTEWTTAYTEGTIKAEALDIDGNKYGYELKTSDDEINIHLHSPLKKLHYDGEDFAEIDIRLQDSQGNPINHQDQKLSVQIKGGAVLMGLESGDPQDLTPYYSHQRSTYRGRLKAYIRSIHGARNAVVEVRNESGAKQVIAF
ncbi:MULTISPECIES: glycoside hydrolase family 2 TIM barrel-domain containing protein [unclassified Oceanispirochaeta]|nr:MULTISPECIES: glycoside hydrolase family 2 TIM barrel-domain containing protein [unclassified Oceanispirochaeta]MBF9015338.1 DUF4982 domain-containing protein [Oceanispirochaeta sp. M2]NPD71796.1 glycoside hydrolase family 2 protein [Oceanispirochaeta sp. M1]